MKRLRLPILVVGLVAGTLLAPSYWSALSGLLGPLSPGLATQADVVRPLVDEGRARNVALDELASRRPDLGGMGVTRAALARGAGDVVTASGFSFHQADPSDVWVIEISGPPQQGFLHVVAVQVVDAKTGEVVASSVGAYN